MHRLSVTRRIGFFCAGLAFLLGCPMEAAQPLTWSVTFDEGLAEDEAVVFEAWIRQGDCSADEGAEHYRHTFSPTEFADSPSRLSPGPHAFRVRAMNDSCVWFASGCAMALLPSSEGEVTTRLSGPETTAACDAASCIGGRCATPPVGVDGACAAFQPGQTCNGEDLTVSDDATTAETCAAFCEADPQVDCCLFVDLGTATICRRHRRGSISAATEPETTAALCETADAGP